MSKTTNKFSPEVRERAVRMVLDHEGEHPSRWATLVSISEKIGCSAHTLNEWVKKAEVDGGYDAASLVAAAVRDAGDTPEQIAGYWNTVKEFPGVFGNYSWTAQQHNGYPDDGVVMSQANSFRDGTFKLAAGYV